MSRWLMFLAPALSRILNHWLQVFPVLARAGLLAQLREQGDVPTDDRLQRRADRAEHRARSDRDPAHDAEHLLDPEALEGEPGRGHGEPHRTLLCAFDPAARNAAWILGIPPPSMSCPWEVSRPHYTSRSRRATNGSGRVRGRGAGGEDMG